MQISLGQIISLFLLTLFSSSSYGEFISLECSKINNWLDEKEVVFKLQLGTETMRAIQSTRKGNLKMDLKVDDKYYNLGQFNDEKKDDFISLLKIDKSTLNAESAKYYKLDEPINCIKL